MCLGSCASGAAVIYLTVQRTFPRILEANWGTEGTLCILPLASTFSVNQRVCRSPNRVMAHTRIYFADEAGNATDYVLTLVPADRRATLIADREKGSGNAVYRLELRLQGKDETVFFDV